MKRDRILFAGNSITKCGPDPEIGWHGCWGMAASAADKDYAHLLMKRIRSVNTDAEFMITSIADFERSFWDYPLEHFKELRDFGADLIIMRIAENVNGDKAAEMNFSRYYKELVDYLNPSGKAVILSTTNFWPHSGIDGQIKKACDENGFVFIDIGELSKDERNMAKDLFEHKGVGMHPSDRGMEKIADTIWNYAEKYVSKVIFHGGV